MPDLDVEAVERHLRAVALDDTLRPDDGRSLSLDGLHGAPDGPGGGSIVSGAPVGVRLCSAAGMSEANAHRVAVFGAGYVGLVTGRASPSWHTVAIRDVVVEKIDALRAREVPIYEPGLDELLERNRERLTFTTDVVEAIDGAEFVYVAVGTPPTVSGDADLSAVWTVIDELPEVDHKVIVVMKSTVPVGTGEGPPPPGRARARPRRLRLELRVHRRGTAIKDFMEPDRIVIGAFDAADADAVAELHAGSTRRSSGPTSRRPR